MGPVTEGADWVVEVLDRAGRVLHRVPVSAARMTLGRAPDNDVILDDPFVDPHHAELQVEEAGVRLRDLDSLNGSWLGTRKRVAAAPLADGQRIHLGHSILRLRSVTAAVPPARRDATSHGWVSLFRRPWMLALGVLATVATLTFDAWVEETRSLNAGILANQLAYPFLGLLLWAGLWAGINRIASHRAHFPVHLAIGTLGLACGIALNQLVPLLAFAVDWHERASWLLLVAEIGLVGVALFAHLQYISHGRRSLQALAAVLVSAILLGSPALGDWLRRDDFSSLPLLEPLLKPPGVRLAEGRSVEDFLADTERFREGFESPP